MRGQSKKSIELIEAMRSITEAAQPITGRGVTIHARYLYGENGLSGYKYLVADIGLPPSSKHSVDRYPNNDGHYEPGNIRWATAKEQASNRPYPRRRRQRRKSAVSS